jgi:hypothetical protein
VIGDGCVRSAAGRRVAHIVASAVERDRSGGLQFNLDGVSAAIHGQRPAGIPEIHGIAAAVENRIAAAAVDGLRAAAL